MYFLQWKVLYFDSNFTVPQGPIDNKWVLVQVMHWRQMPNRCQAIIKTIADPVHRRIYAALGGDELKFSPEFKRDSLTAVHETTKMAAPIVRFVNLSDLRELMPFFISRLHAWCFWDPEHPVTRQYALYSIYVNNEVSDVWLLWLINSILLSHHQPVLILNLFYPIFHAIFFTQ